VSDALYPNPSPTSGRLEDIRGDIRISDGAALVRTVDSSTGEVVDSELTVVAATPGAAPVLRVGAEVKRQPIRPGRRLEDH
jgi:hypothetical protein